MVVGLGAHGSATIATLAKRGCNVLGIEAFPRANHSHGSSHGRSRIIRQAYFEHPEYVPLLKRSFELWRDLEMEDISVSEGAGVDVSVREPLLTMTGALMIGERTSEIIKGTLSSVSEHNLKHRILSADEVNREFRNAFVLKESEMGIWEDDAGYLVPEACVEAYLSSAERTGNADMIFGESLASFAAVESGGVNVTTSKGRTFSANKIVLCVGAWAPEILGKEVMEIMPLTILRKVLMWFEPRENNDLEKSSVPTEGVANDGTIVENSPFNRSRCPVYIWDLGTRAFYGFPRQAMNGKSEGCKVAFGEKVSDGVETKGISVGEVAPGAAVSEGCKVAMHYIRQSVDGEPIQNECTPSTIDRSVADEEITEMRKYLQDRIPNIANGVLLRTETCMYTCTKDEHFWIDFHPHHLSKKEVIIASPCSGHGFKMAPVIGEILADLVLFGTTRHNISLFSTEARKSPSIKDTHP